MMGLISVMENDNDCEEEVMRGIHEKENRDNNLILDELDRETNDDEPKTTIKAKTLKKKKK